MRGRPIIDTGRSGEAERRRAAYGMALAADERLGRTAPPMRASDVDSLRCPRCRELGQLCAEHARLVVELL